MITVTTKQKLKAWICGELDLPIPSQKRLIEKYLRSTDEWRCEMLIFSIVCGNTHAFSRLVELGHPFNSVRPPFNTIKQIQSPFQRKHPLIALCTLSNHAPQRAIEMAKILSKAGQNLSFSQEGRNEPKIPTLAYMMRAHHPDMAYKDKNENLAKFFSALIELGVNPNYQDEEGETCLHSLCDSQIMIDNALRCGADPLIRNKKGQTAGEASRSAFKCFIYPSENLP